VPSSAQKRIDPIVESLLAGLVGLVIGGFIMLAFGHNPLAAYRSLLMGSVGSVYSIAESLAVATPLILTALTLAVAMR